MLGSFSNIVFFAVSILSFSACNNVNGGNTDLSEIENSDSIPVSVKRLIRAVADNDTSVFAGLISYPLARPYPLHDLNTKEEMEKYYPQIIDDSLRSVLTTSKVSDWEEYGWRGWSLKDGDYIWIDENLYDIPYISNAERITLDSLASLEISTLHPSLRDGWRPIGAMRSSDKKTVCRIDMQKNTDSMPLYRLSVYKNETSLDGIPTEIFTGYKIIEGTAETGIYNFSGTNGRHAVFEAEIPDGSTPKIEFSSADSSSDTLSVERIYWLDQFKPELFKKK